MNEEEQENSLMTFRNVIFAAIEDKSRGAKWKAKCEKANIRCNLVLQMEKDEYFNLYFIMKPGENAIVEKGVLEDYDLQLTAAPVDLIYFCDGTNGVIHMVTKKNEYGDTKLRIKKGIRNVFKLLFVKDLLIFK